MSEVDILPRGTRRIPTLTGRIFCFYEYQTGNIPEKCHLYLPQQIHLSYSTQQIQSQVALVPTSHTIYAVLGFLSIHVEQYRQYRDPGYLDDLIEHFFTNESTIAQVFEQYLFRLFEEHNIQPDLRSERDNGHTFFYSPQLSQLLNSYYSQRAPTENNNLANQQKHRFIMPNARFPSINFFPPHDREAMLSFLIGAYQRYGSHNLNIYYFPSNHHKAKLVYQLLRDVDSPQVVFVYSIPYSVPSVFRVAFEPTAELIQRLNLQLGEYENEQ